jgi:hypothetical protein
MIIRNDGGWGWWRPILAAAALLTLSACVVHERVYYDDAYRYQHRQHGLYNDYEYRNSYDYGNQRYQRPARVYYYDDDDYYYYYGYGYGYRHRD